MGEEPCGSSSNCLHVQSRLGNAEIARGFGAHNVGNEVIRKAASSGGVQKEKEDYPSSNQTPCH